MDHPGRVLLAFPSTGHDISTRWLRSYAELDVWDRERAVAVWEAAGAPDSPNPLDLRLLHNYVAPLALPVFHAVPAMSRCAQS